MASDSVLGVDEQAVLDMDMTAAWQLQDQTRQDQTTVWQPQAMEQVVVLQVTMWMLQARWTPQTLHRRWMAEATPRDLQWKRTAGQNGSSRGRNLWQRQSRTSRHGNLWQRRSWLELCRALALLRQQQQGTVLSWLKEFI